MDRVLVALDVPTAAEAIALADTLRGAVGGFKIGSQLFTAAGPDIVRTLVGRGDRVFLDLKFHDIPTTARKALEAVLPLDPALVNVHAQGGPAMLEAASQAVRRHREQGGRTELLAVTVLTSLGREEWARLGHAGDPSEKALDLAELAEEHGCDGVVCSAWEARRIGEVCGAHFRRLCPGIRPKGSEAQDQARVMDPATALREGATWIVVGRPITGAADPAAAAQSILRELEQA